MKILHISKYYSPFIGGVEQVAKDIVDSLKGIDGVEQKIICFNDSKSSGTDKKKNKKDVVEGIEVIRCGEFIKVSSQTISLSYRKELKRLMDDFNPDVVILHYPNPFATHYLRKYYKKEFKLIVYWHLDIIKQKFLRLFFGRQNENLVNRADVLIATSPNYIDGSRYLSKHKNKCEIVPCCIRNDRMKETSQSKLIAQRIRDEYKGKIICFGVGRHVPYKGYEYLIKSSEFLDERFIVIIGGEGPITSDLEYMARRYNNVKLVGRLSDEELVAYYSACDIVCFPSITKNEAFGIALAEGMSFGKPAVTFNIPGSGVNFVNLNRVTGLECKNRNIHDYANALIELANHKTYKEELGINAKKRVEELFSYQTFTNNIQDIVLIKCMKN